MGRGAIRSLGCFAQRTRSRYSTSAEQTRRKLQQATFFRTGMLAIARSSAVHVSAPSVFDTSSRVSERSSRRRESARALRTAPVSRRCRPTTPPPPPRRCAAQRPSARLMTRSHPTRPKSPLRLRHRARHCSLARLQPRCWRFRPGRGVPSAESARRCGSGGAGRRAVSTTHTRRRQSSCRDARCSGWPLPPLLSNSVMPATFAAATEPGTVRKRAASKPTRVSPRSC